MNHTIRFKPLLLGLVGFGVVLSMLTATVSVSAAPAPAQLVVNSEATYAHDEFGATTEITIEKNGVLIICTGQTGTATLNANITFSNAGSGNDPKIIVEACMGATIDGISYTPASGLRLNGSITLSGTDGEISANYGYLSFNGALTRNGQSLKVTSKAGSKVMGSGTAGSVTLESGGLIAPGNSPGTLNTGNLTMVSGSAYEFEIGGTTAGTEYDQINVTGTVDLGNGILEVKRYNDFKPQAGQSFIIINNDGADAVSGIFAGKPEYTSFAVDGYVFRISYVGGDGNDVVLTVVSLPSTPDTGSTLLTTNPIAVLFTTSMAAGGIMFIGRRYNAQINRR